MTRKTPTFFILGIALIALVTDLRSAGYIASAAADAMSPQTTITGDWKATLVKDDSKINVNFERRTEKGRHGSMGQTYEFSELGSCARAGDQRGAGAIHPGARSRNDLVRGQF